MKQSLLLFAAALSAMVFSSCTNMSTGSSSGGSLGTYEAYDVPAKLPSNPSAVRVKVSLSKQLVYVMENGQPLMVMPVSVGEPATPTPSGSFRIFKKEHLHRANSHGYAYSGNQARKAKIGSKPAGWSFKGTPMPYWCEFKSNYGFHTGWVKHRPCSHGCIRMHQNASPKFFRLVSTGTPVSIAHTQPEDATLGANVKKPIDAGPLPDYTAQNSLFYVGNDYFTKHKTPTYN